MAKKVVEKKIYEVNLANGSWESLALIAKRAYKNGDIATAKTKCVEASMAYNKLVNEERGTSGKVYGGFMYDQKVVPWTNGGDDRMNTFIEKHWDAEVTAQ